MVERDPYDRAGERAEDEARFQLVRAKESFQVEHELVRLDLGAGQYESGARYRGDRACLRRHWAALPASSSYGPFDADDIATVAVTIDLGHGAT